MKKMNFKIQKRSFQILTVIGLSFLLHACGNKDGGGSNTPAITYYSVMSDRRCWMSNGQMAPNAASCNGAPSIDYNGQCISAQGQPLSIQSCTPSGWYMEGGVCRNGLTGAYGQQPYGQQQYGQYGQQPYGQYAQQPPAGACGGQTGFNQRYGYNPATNSFNTQQAWNQQQGYSQFQTPGYQYQQQQQYTPPSSYWGGGASATWSSGYQPYTGWSNY